MVKKMNNTKIEWCDSTWNPVTGCYHNCEYCYARRIANRFGGCDEFSTYRPYTKDWRRADNNDLKIGEGTSKNPMLFEIEKPLLLPRKLNIQATEKLGRQIFDNKKAPYPFGFEPTLHRYRLNDYINKKGRTIFVCSMADLFGEWVPDSWIEEVFAACNKAPQHRYLFLTKNPQRYCNLLTVGKLPKQDNFWYGTTLTNKGARFFGGAFGYHKFLSIEPLREYLDVGLGSFSDIEWIVLGAETGKRKDKVIPQKEWIDNICDVAGLTRAAVFMKESLLPIMDEENMRRELPWRDIR